MWNISYFKTFLHRLMRGNGLVGDKIYFEANAVPDWEPVKFIARSSLLVYLGERVTMGARVLNLLQLEDIFYVYTI